MHGLTQLTIFFYYKLVNPVDRPWSIKETGLDQSKMISLGQMKTTRISPEPTENDILDADLLNPVIRPSFAGHDDLHSIRRLPTSIIRKQLA